ncbi:histidinol-phosphate transaminase [Loigolactobacillus jiayinensis]|uniref:Histidinol-phosphate aminotransferase n=1 Tax=Loigolactobacillus jiayinensis TaxID=2486016 RepID=A0ABW1RE08_9LACO|nr:histidinol-phosphate transaminase [Loigolactobacillus jiayinensis]
MLKKTVSQLQPYVPETPLPELEEKLGLAKVVRLSANENPFGTSPKVQQALQNWDFSNSRYYPDGDASALRQAVAEYINVAPERLLFGNGLDEVIELVSRTFLENTDEVLELGPTFSEYKLHAQIEAAVVRDVSVQTDGIADLTALAAAITPQTKLIWLCNPNNPTGTAVTCAAIAEFMAQVPENVLVLIDEAYMDFVDDLTTYTALPLLTQYANLMVLRTFSKAYGLANFRVGYAVMPPKLAPSLQSVRLPYNLGAVAQLAAKTALADQDFLQTTVTRVQKARQQWEEFLQQNGFTFYRSQANFTFFKAPQALALADDLLHHGFIVRTGLRPDWLRITFGTAEQNAKLQQLILAFYQQ